MEEGEIRKEGGNLQGKGIGDLETIVLEEETEGKVLQETPEVQEEEVQLGDKDQLADGTEALEEETKAQGEREAAEEVQGRKIDEILEGTGQEIETESLRI